MTGLLALVKMTHEQNSSPDALLSELTAKVKQIDEFSSFNL